MATIYKMDEHLSIEDKWKICKSYYEKAYSRKGKQVRFRTMPSHDQVEDLFKKIGKFNLNVSVHFQKKPGLVDNFLKNAGFISSDEEEKK